MGRGSRASQIIRSKLKGNLVTTLAVHIDLDVALATRQKLYRYLL